MRTTLDIDDDVLIAAKDLANAQNTTAGKVISDLARHTLTQPLAGGMLAFRDGFPVLPKRGGMVTPDLVKKLSEDDR